MTLTYHDEVTQGSDEWLAMRCGLLTASEMKLIVTPTLKAASNDKERQHLFELAAQRITKYVEPYYVSDDMLRGHAEEVYARMAYNSHFGETTECGFVTNDEFGFTIGYSPDALVGDDGLIECKSRRQKYQAQTIIEGVMPDDYLIQVQAGLLVTRRKWVDFLSYCGGMPMVRIRVFPNPRVQNAIVEAATAFEERLAEALLKYPGQVARLGGVPTERHIEQEMHL